jgi:hypothetical protein
LSCRALLGCSTMLKQTTTLSTTTIRQQSQPSTAGSVTLQPPASSAQLTACLLACGALADGDEVSRGVCCAVDPDRCAGACVLATQAVEALLTRTPLEAPLLLLKTSQPAILELSKPTAYAFSQATSSSPDLPHTACCAAGLTVSTSAHLFVMPRQLARTLVKGLMVPSALAAGITTCFKPCHRYRPWSAL